MTPYLKSVNNHFVTYSRKQQTPPYIPKITLPKLNLSASYQQNIRKSPHIFL